MASPENEIVHAPAEHEIKITRWKVREGFQVSRNQIILLYVVPGSGDKELKRLKVAQTGVVKKRLFKDGDTVGKNAPLLELGPCIHTTVIKEMCADCGADLRKEENGSNAANEAASVPMIHSVPELKVTQKLAQKLGKADTKRLLEDKKLVLLVDLDQTIIHTTNDNVPNNLRGVYHFQLYGPNSPWYHTRLRPGTFEFLSKMEPLYELHICTFGARNYAHMIAQFLDEDGKYFSHRILSRDECFNLTSKTDNLRALFPCGDSMVCIIDDREDVWNMASNLIQVKPYHFFQHTGDINAPPGMAKHELDGKGVNFKDLAKSGIEKNESSPDDDKKKTVDVTDEEDAGETTVKTPEDSCEKDSSSANIPPGPHDTDDLVDSTKSASPTSDEVAKQSGSDSDENLIDIDDPDDYLLYLETVLKQIHKRFYECYEVNQAMPDLKMLIPKIRSEILSGKTLVFSGIVPNQLKLEQSKAYVIAKNMGATVKQQLTENTTHLVAATSGTVKVNAARKRSEIKVVTPEWLWTCAERWECVDERLFPLDPLKPSKMRQPPPHCHSPEHAANYNDTDSSDSSITKRSKPKSVAHHRSANAGPSGSSSSSARKTSNTDDDEDDDDEPKFMDTINPLMSFTNDDLADMNQDFDQFFESDESSSDDEPYDMENPPSDKRLKKKRRHEDEKELRTKERKFFRSEEDEQQPRRLQDMASSSRSPPKKRKVRKDDNRTSVDQEGNRVDGGENYVDPESEIDSSGTEKEVPDYEEDEDRARDEDEMPSERFRRGGDLPSDLDIGSECGSAGSDDPIDDDGGDWSQMGAALERDFLGLD